MLNMEPDKDKITKLNFQSRLRLRRNNSDSSQNSLNSHVNSKSESNVIKNSEFELPLEENASNSTNNEDTLKDFKSPTREEKVINPILNKFKIENQKTKKKILKSKSKKNSSKEKQPSIESSFFKPPNQIELKESVPCPLCLRPFKDDIVCTNHMKTCASKNNITTMQLLHAKQLQDRQAEERKAMGLLAAPVIPEKKKVYRSKKYSTGDDPQLQLALAISESLYQEEQIVELEQAAFLEGLPPECIKEMSSEERRTTLQNFGFTTNKPISENNLTHKTRRKKFLGGPTILQTRSKEDKDKVLTERITCIITGDDALTQVQQNDISYNKIPTTLRSKRLKVIEEIENRLWDKSRLTKKFNDFYVKDLKLYFSKSDDHVKTDDDSGLSNVNYNEDILLNNSIFYESINVDIKDLDIDDICTNNSSISEFEIMDADCNFVEKIISNWAEALNNSVASDIIIFVKNNEYIYAHKLVFHVQCSNILIDVETNNTETKSWIKEKICWFDKDLLAALAFLEFIYVGSINKYDKVFEKEELLSQVRRLATMYQVKQIFNYLKQQKKARKQNDISNTNEESNSKNKQSDTIKVELVDESMRKCYTPTIRKSYFSEVQSSKNTVERFTSDPTPLANEVQCNSKSSLSENNCFHRRITTSPDLFDSIDDDYNNTIEENNPIQKDTRSQNAASNEDYINDALTQKSIQDIKHEAVTPKRGRSPEICDTEMQDTMNLRQDRSPDLSDIEMQGAITPKYVRSPESYGTEIQEAVTPKRRSLHSYDREIEKAVTPKRRRSVQSSDIINEILTPENATSPAHNKRDIDINNATNAEDGESIYTVVTPPHCDNSDSLLTEENLHKVRSSLSLFIDKVHKQNSKTILDSYSESDDDSILKVKRKNPFLKRNNDYSYKFLQNDGNISSEHRGMISLIDNDIQTTKASTTNKTENLSKDLLPNRDKNPNTNVLESSNTSDEKYYSKTSPAKDKLARCNLTNNVSTSCSNPEINLSNTDDEELNITTDESEMSRYSKYKSKNKYNNSIAKYREKLNFKLKTQLAKDLEISEANTKMIQTLSPSSKTSSNRCSISNSTVNTNLTKNLIPDGVSSSDEDLVYKGLKSKTILNFDKLKDEAKACNTSNIQTSTPENEKLIRYSTACSPVNTKSSKTSMSKSQSFSNLLANRVNKHNSKPSIHSKSEDDILSNKKQLSTLSNIIDDVTIVSDSDNEEELKKSNNESKLSSKHALSDIQNDTTFPLGLVDERFSTSKIEKSIALKNQSKNVIIDLSLESDEDIHNDSTVPNISTKPNSLVEGGFSNKELLNSECSITSDSPSSCNKVCKTLTQKNTIKDSTGNTNIQKEETINLSPISIISSSEDGNIIDKNKESDFNPIRDEFLDDVEFDPKWNTDEDSPNLEENLSCSESALNKITFSPVSSTSEVNISALNTSPILNKNRHSQKSCKSSNNQIGPSIKQIEIDKQSFTTPQRNKNLSQRYSNQSDITPPLDYSAMSTPDLKKEMRKFGLKLQNKSKAKLILQHIYEETHPIISSQKRSSSSNSSDDEEPPVKKQHVKADECKNNVKLGRKSCNRPMIAEEMDYDDPDVGTSLENSKSIDDAFKRLIASNKELHRKVLLYEPLPLESVHTMLKENGFKCKINSLMDYLDSECITFQVQNVKGNRTKAKK